MDHIDVLPSEISVHIFSLLPIESVSDCVLVNKSWKEFIHSPSFLVMHANRLLHLGEKRLNCLRLARNCVVIFIKSRGVSGTPAGAACFRNPNEVSSVLASCMSESGKVSVQQDLEGETRESHRICQTVPPPPPEPLCPEPANTLGLKEKFGAQEIVGAEEPNAKKRKVPKNIEEIIAYLLQQLL